MKTRVGVIGCGNIAKAYLPTLQSFPHLELSAVADLNPDAARERAETFHVPRVLSPDALLADPDIDLVVNLTVPKAHAEVDRACLAHGKHVFSEKPFALTRESALEVVEAGRKSGLRVGCAPDTVLGAGTQTCRKLIDDGVIGRPVAFTANMLSAGVEHWHPSPEFYYERGGGPVFDMGPYYIHALLWLLGPVRYVTARATMAFKERLITSQPKAGKIVRVEIPTHVCAILEFHCGVTGTMTMSFDIKGGHRNPRLEIYGEAGSLEVPDPNTFGGPVRIAPDWKEWKDVALTHGYDAPSRGLGAADLAAAVSAGRDHRANERLALHCVDIMQSLHESSESERRVELSTTCERPAPMPIGLPPFVLD